MREGRERVQTRWGPEHLLCGAGRLLVSESPAPLRHVREAWGRFDIGRHVSSLSLRFLLCNVG